MALTTYCVGLPGRIGAWAQSEKPPILAAGMVAVPYEPAAGLPLPLMMIGADGATLALATDLDIARETRWIEAKAVCLARKNGGCRTPKGVVQTDAESRNDIRMIAADALSYRTDARLKTLLVPAPEVAPSWSTSFRMLDDAEVPHDADEMIALARAVNQHVEACKAARVAIRTQIFAAPTIAAVEAVDIAAGYPATI